MEAQLAEARAASLGLQDGQARRRGSLVFRLIRGGLSILAGALALQQVWAPRWCKLHRACMLSRAMQMPPVATGTL